MTHTRQNFEFTVRDLALYPIVLLVHIIEPIVQSVSFTLQLLHRFKVNLLELTELQCLILEHGMSRADEARLLTNVLDLVPHTHNVGPFSGNGLTELFSFRVQVRSLLLMVLQFVVLQGRCRWKIFIG